MSQMWQTNKVTGGGGGTVLSTHRHTHIYIYKITKPRRKVNAGYESHAVPLYLYLSSSKSAMKIDILLFSCPISIISHVLPSY
jgi:hypothetical protein